MKIADKILCDIYKTATREEMYLYLSREDGFKSVPEVLLKQFGKPVLVTTMLLTATKKLARADASKVMDDITRQGFYLQMPPPPVPLTRTEQH
jgi:uncharacterized protein YcgL (UPF0745 family)